MIAQQAVVVTLDRLLGFVSLVVDQQCDVVVERRKRIPCSQSLSNVNIE
jgi:hypothetical protein